MWTGTEFEVILLRHGKTLANEKRLYCGKTDLDLSENGVKEIEDLKEKINYPKSEKYFSSNLKRAKQTLKILYDEPEFQTISKLNEIDFGDFEMVSYDDLKDNADYINWITDKIPSPPNGETKEDFEKRVLEGFYELVENGNSLLVCHGGVIVKIMENLFPNQKNFYQWQPDNGRGYKLTFVNKKAVKYVEI